MENLYKKLLFGVGVAFAVLLIFLVFDTYFIQGFKYKQEALSNSINKEDLRILRNEAIQNLELRVDVMEKYIDDGQKNLDHWLKLLTLVLSLLIGVSVYTGLKERELAKDELKEIRTTRDSIDREAINAEDRLKQVKEQITEIVKTEGIAKEIKEKMTLQLDEIGSKKELVLNESQTKIIDEAISKSKEYLEKTGIETLKNLYYAKALKAQDEKKWEEVIRLVSSYIDFDEKNELAFSIRSYAYYELFKASKDTNIFNKSLLDVNEVIRITPTDSWAFNHRGNLYFYKNDDANALSNYSDAILQNPKFSLAYTNRSIIYRRMGKLNEAEKDLAKSKELDDKID